MLTFHAIGDWLPGRVQCAWVESSHVPTPQVVDAIERTWESLSRKTHVHLFDGPMCRLESASFARDGVKLHLSRTSYKPFVGTNMHNQWIAGRYGAGMLANPVGLSCALESAEGHLMMGRRNDRVAYYPSRVHPFSGALEPAEQIDVFAEIRRELQEELSLEERDVDEIHCAGLVSDHLLMQPELIFFARSRLSRQEIEERLGEDEHAGLVGATADQTSILLHSEPRPTPVGVAAILLWARLRISRPAFDDLRELMGVSPPLLVCD